MTSLVLHPQHECAPHVIRTLAMACAIALNLAALLIALRPLPLTLMALPTVQPAIRTVLLQPPHALPIPPPPVLQPVHHRVPHSTPTLREPQPIADVPTPVANPVTTTETSNISTPVTQPVAQPSTSTGSSDATIAYETATPPPYPIAELRAGVQGTVLLRVLVDETGKPVQVLVVKSSGSRELDQAALKHVLAAWRFHPAQRNGHAIPAWAQVPVEFKLSGA
ncbi:MAG TPA: energy transducer TonB [Rhodanobacteraceae bacterium]|nr:energy transducer TonB [Rhodanobacteraceae bacterium]